MFLVSNFPHVPLATTNPATEGAAREQQLRQPLPAPEAMVKSAAERRLEPQHERPLALRGGKQQKRNTSSDSEQQQDPEQQSNAGTDALKALLAQANPTLESPFPRRHSDSVREPMQDLALDAEQAQQFSQVIAQTYGDTVARDRLSGLSVST